MSDKKAREFWLYETENKHGEKYMCDIVDLHDSHPEDSDMRSIHVIEYSYAQELEAKLADALSANTELSIERSKLIGELRIIEKLKDTNAALESRCKKLETLLKSLDQHFCENIIDPCGYDPEKESQKDLAHLVKCLSLDNEIKLKEVRQALAQDDGE